jgi:membrane protein DedA with SNARE-associated domain
LLIILLRIIWLLRSRSIGIEIADKFVINSLKTPLKIEEKFRRKGALGVLFGRHILGLRTQIFLMARVMRMSATKFFIADPATAILALTVALFWAGIVFLKN